MNVSFICDWLRAFLSRRRRGRPRRPAARRPRGGRPDATGDRRHPSASDLPGSVELPLARRLRAAQRLLPLALRAQFANNLADAPDFVVGDLRQFLLQAFVIIRLAVGAVTLSSKNGKIY